MTCIPQGVRSGAQEQAAVARSTPDRLLLPACRVHRTNLLQGSHCESGLRAGEEYFFILVTPADPESFVVVSNTKRVVARPSIRPNPSVGAPSKSPVVAKPIVNSNRTASAPAPPTAQRDEIQVPAQVRHGESPASISRPGNSVSRPRSESPELVNGALVPSRLHDVAQVSRAAPGALNQPGQNMAGGSFCKLSRDVSSLNCRMLTHRFAVRGPRLVPAHEGLLKFSFDHFEWYSAENCNNVQTYIGIAGPKDGLPDKSRKRLRID